MFLDASAIVACLIPEPDASYLKRQMDSAKPPFFCSPVSVMESVLGLARSFRKNENDPVTEDMLATAQLMVEEFLSDLSVKEVSISPDIGRKALMAMKTYGKVVRHPAQLNMGDCYSYV